MAVNLDGNTLYSQTRARAVQSDPTLSRAGSAGISNSSREDAKTEKAGKDFESILLGSWLQEAEKTFATVPGGDGQDDEDPGKDQFQGIAMQGLAGSLTASGGIGIAKMITSSLRAHQGSPENKAAAQESTSGAQSSAVGASPGSGFL